MTAYLTRDLEQAVFDALGAMPVVVVTGMRQVGKSTLIQSQPDLAKRRYVTLDDMAYLEAARLNPKSLVQSDVPITIDEAQKAPNLLTAIKREVDRDRRPGKYLLSGSSNFGLLKDVAESLAGRAVYLTLHPFSRREIAGKSGSEPFLVGFFRSIRLPSRPAARPFDSAAAMVGGFPSVCLRQAGDPTIWFKGYEQTYLERDIRLGSVEDLIAFRHLLQLATFRTGQLLNVSELARDAKMSASRASRYLNLMEASFVLRRLPPHLSNRAKRLLKSPKLFVGDSGLACYLSGIERLDPGADEPMRGAIVETYVAQNLASIVDARWPRAHLTFWNIQGRHEVDFVIECGRETLAIKVKAGSRWGPDDLSGLKAFIAGEPKCRAGILAYGGQEAAQLGERLWAIPLDLLLS